MKDLFTLQANSSVNNEVSILIIVSTNFKVELASSMGYFLVIKEFIKHHICNCNVQNEEEIRLSTLEKPSVILCLGQIGSSLARKILSRVKKNGMGLAFVAESEGSSVNLLEDAANSKLRLCFGTSLPEPFSPLEGVVIDKISSQPVKMKEVALKNVWVLATLANPQKKRNILLNPAIIAGEYGKGRVLYSSIDPLRQNWFYIGCQGGLPQEQSSPPFLIFAFRWLINMPFVKLYPHKGDASYEFLIRFDDINSRINDRKFKEYIDTWIRNTDYPLNVAVVPDDLKSNPKLTKYLINLKSKYDGRICILKHGNDHAPRVCGEYSGTDSDLLRTRKGFDEFIEAFGFRPMACAEPYSEVPMSVLEFYSLEDTRIYGVCSNVNYGLGRNLHSIPWNNVIVLPSENSDISHSKRWRGTISRVFHPVYYQKFTKGLFFHHLLRFLRTVFQRIWPEFINMERRAWSHIALVKSTFSNGVSLTYDEKIGREYVKSKIERHIYYDVEKRILTFDLDYSQVPPSLIDYVEGITIEVYLHGRDVVSIHLDEDLVEEYSRHGNFLYITLPKLSRERHRVTICFSKIRLKQEPAKQRQNIA